MGAFFLYQKIALYAGTGKMKSIAIHSEELEKDYDNPEQWSLLIAVYYEVGNYERAYDLVVKSAKKFPDNDFFCVCGGYLQKAEKV